jgi:alpha-glucosidase
VPEPHSNRRWWDDAAGYQVYVPSFADGNGDGMGDLIGVLERLDYLAWLGVDLIWLSPFYVSPLADYGYDVADHCRVDPRFGDLEVFDALVERAHRHGIRVLLDFVANHTSDEHPWFRQSRSSRSDPKRHWYIWRDGAGAGRPPNNWVSAFGGPAWAFDPASGQWWLHLHLPEQPDVNWNDPEVAEAYDGILRFWLERSVDGFRIDVAHAFLKHPDLPDNPERVRESGELREPGTVEDWERFEHRYDLDQPGVLDIHRRWRKLADEYDALLLGEVYLLQGDRLARYLAAGDGLHAAFWVQPLALGWDPAAVVRSLQEGLTSTPPGSLAWVQGNHDDQSRAVTRFGGGEAGRRGSLAFSTLVAALPGMAFTYQGEELGLEDAEPSLDEMRDPLAVRNAAPGLGRDRVRTPMPWEPGPGLGFTTNPRPWLPVASRNDWDTVEAQRADETSMLHRFRDLLRVRRELPEGGGLVEWIGSGAVAAYRRGDVVVAVNARPTTTSFEAEHPCVVVYSTRVARTDLRIDHGSRPLALTLAPDEAVILRLISPIGTRDEGT